MQRFFAVLRALKAQKPAFEEQIERFAIRWRYVGSIAQYCARANVCVGGKRTLGGHRLNGEGDLDASAASANAAFWVPPEPNPLR
jgi:hypothetical protein